MAFKSRGEVVNIAPIGPGADPRVTLRLAPEKDSGFSEGFLEFRSSDPAIKIGSHYEVSVKSIATPKELEGQSLFPAESQPLPAPV
jgi:hypothetical protein